VGQQCLMETSNPASRSNMTVPRVAARRRRTVRPEPVPHGPPSPFSAPGGPYGRPMPGHGPWTAPLPQRVCSTGRAVDPRRPTSQGSDNSLIWRFRAPISICGPAARMERS